ncbi:MAG: hypothetical protein JEZ03_16060, partial [Bacteroidales bacterium]|nr:hypothetical protein [Bacteroidales bacterium]
STIAGKDSFFKGLSKVALNPGIHVKGGFSFDFSKYNQIIRSVEAGVIVDGMIIPYQIMFDRPAEIIIPHIFIRVAFGNKFN